MGRKQLTRGGTGLYKRGGNQRLNPSGGDRGCSKVWEICFSKVRVSVELGQT